LNNLGMISRFITNGLNLLGSNLYDIEIISKNCTTKLMY